MDCVCNRLIESPVDLEKIAQRSRSANNASSASAVTVRRGIFVRLSSWNRGRGARSDRIHQADLQRCHGGLLRLSCRNFCVRPTATVVPTVRYRADPPVPRGVALSRVRRTELVVTMTY